MTEKTAKADKQPIDWELVERDFRAGIKPLRQIGEEHGVSHTAIKKKADKEGWTRDLKDRIAAKAEEKVSRAAVSKEVSTETKVAETQVVEANAELQYRIRMEHRQDIGRARTLYGKLLGELELTTDNLDLFEELGDLLRSEDRNGQDRLNDLYRKVVSLGGRVDNAKKLGEMLEKLVKLEREAFGIKSEEEQSTPVDDLLHKIAKERGLVS